MSKLFPILADPNPPSSFDGLDVSLVAGQITALNGADSFNMTASTLTANGVSASWADIVDGVVNPPSAPTLQSVLDVGSSATGVSITLTDEAVDPTASILSNSQLVLSDLNHSSTLSAVEHIFAKAVEGTLDTATLNQNGLTVVQPSGPTAIYRYNADITEGNFNANLSSSQLTMSNTASGATASMTPLALNMSGSGASPFDGVGITDASLTYNITDHSSTLSALSHAFAGPTSTATLNEASLAIVDAAYTSQLSSSALTLSDVATGDANAQGFGSISLISVAGAVSNNMSAAQSQILSDAGSSTMTVGSLVLMDAPNTSIATLAYNSVAVGKDEDYVEMTKDQLVIHNATVSTSISPSVFAMGSLSYNGQITAPTAANGEKLIIASNKQIQLDAEQNVVLSAGDDSVSFMRNAVITQSAGGSTDQYLSVLINNVPYRISLLAQPVFPLRTITTINIGGGQNIFVQEPYIACDFFTVSFTVSGFTGSTNSSNFEILSYPTPAFQAGQSYSMRKVFINGNGTYSFTQQNYTPERYNALQFFQTSANAFSVSSFTINGTQQIASPNPVPLVCPPV